MPTDALLDAAEFGPTASSLTPEQRKAQEDMRKAYMNQVGWGLGTSAAATAAQFGAMALPTAQDARNKAQLAKLNAALGRGEMAATPQAALIRQEFNQQMGTAGALGRQAQQQTASRLAASGDSLPVAQRMAMEKAAAQPAQQAAAAAGQARAASNLQEMARQIEELDSRTAYKAEKQKALLQAGSQLIGQAAPLVGQVVAAQKVSKIDWGNVSDDPAEQLLLLQALGAKGSMTPVQSLVRSTPSKE